MAKTEKSKAELYREERKQRIQSAAKKNAKKSRRNPKVGRIIGRIIGIVLTIAIVCGLCFVVLDQAGVIARAQTAFSVGSYKVSVAEYGYLYYMQYQNLISRAQEAEQSNGYNYTGFDYNKAPADQDSTYTDDDGNPIRWDVQLKTQTEDYLQEFFALYDNAIKDGYKLTDEEKTNIDENIENQRKNAAGASSEQTSVSMSLNAYLKANYGKGVNESMLRSLMEKELIVQRFSEDKQKSFEDKYDEAALDAEYDKDPSEYNVVDLRFYAFEADDVESADGDSEEKIEAAKKAAGEVALKDAEDFLTKVKDVDSFKAAAKPLIEKQKALEAASTEPIATEDETAEAADEKTDEEAEVADEETAEDTDAKAEEVDDSDVDAQTKATGATKSSLSSAISEDAAKWAMSAKAGAKKAFLSSDSTHAYAMYIVKAAYKQETVDVRHILFLTQDTDTSEKLSDDEIAEKEAKKDEVWQKWQDLADADKTEDAFADLAKEYSEDPGSQENGGLYEGVAPGQMVDSFNDWIFDDSRKEGDTDVIESEYGWHIMYYVGNKDYSYRKSLRTTHTQDDYSSWLEDELKKDDFKITENAAGLAKGYARAERMINATVSYMQSNANSANS